ncbi:hypothetical protein [Rhodococcus sp. NPDC049939]|uniref:hypothetical protein n=1 Tax=Rhodococcus sp. NPDC049939 TaxID=3155511 RepID=UPI0033F8C3EA
MPVAVANTVPEGRAYAFAADSVLADTDASGVQMQRSENVSDDFTKNLVRGQVEGRYNFSVTRPLGVVQIATTA